MTFFVALLTVPKDFLVALGKTVGKSNILQTCDVETQDLPSKTLTEVLDPSVSLSLEVTRMPGSPFSLIAKIRVVILD